MNKIFKVIWSKSKQCYVVVSEMAKNKTGKKKIVVASILAALAMQVGVVADVTAADRPTGTIEGGTKMYSNLTNGLAIGNESQSNSNQSIAIGYRAIANSQYADPAQPAVAIGAGAHATGRGGVSLGLIANSSVRGTAIGSATQATGFGAFAGGTYAQATNAGDVAIGGASSDQFNNYAVASGGYSVAIGTAAKADGGAGVSIGYKTNAKTSNSLAIGSESQATGEGAVAVGRKNTSTGASSTVLGILSTANATSATAVGMQTTATGENSLAVGHKSSASGKNGVAVGTNETTAALGGVAVGQAAKSNKFYSVAMGMNVTADGDNSVALGGSASANSDGTIAIGSYGSTPTKATGNRALAIGSATTANGLESIAIGSRVNSTSQYSIAIGTRANASAVKSVAIGPDSSVTVDGGVALGRDSVANVIGGVTNKGYNPNTNRTDNYSGLTGNVLTSTTGAVSIGNGTTVTRQLTGLAAGTRDTDAVNVAQLKSVNLAFSGNVNTGNVNIANSTLGLKGDNTYITTSANGQNLTISGKTQNINVTNGQASANAAGMADSKNVADAINKAISANAYHWKLAADRDPSAPEVINKSDTVIFGGDNNITVTRSGKKITTSLNKAITVDTVKANRSVTVSSGGNQITLDGTNGSVKGRNFTGDSFKAGDNVLSNTTLQIGPTTGSNNVTITRDGLTAKTATKTVKFGTDGISAGGQQITNVSSGGNVGTNAANITDVKNAVAAVTLKLDTNSKTGTVKLSESPLKVIGANGIRTDLLGTNNGSLVVGLDKSTVNATTKGIGLTGDTGSTGLKYLKDGDATFKVAGDGDLVTTKASATGVQVAVDSAKVKDLAVGAVTVSKANTADNPITITPTAGTNSKDYAIGIDTTKLANQTQLTYKANGANENKVSLANGLNFTDGTFTKATVGTNGTVTISTATETITNDADGKAKVNSPTDGLATAKNVADSINKAVDGLSQNLTVSDGTTDGAVNLKNQKLTVSGTNGVTTTVNGQTVTVGLDATTKTKVDNASTAVARNISLGADSGTASSQSLKDGDVAFNVKAATGDLVSTKMNGNTVEISTKRAAITSDANTGVASVTGDDGLATSKNVADAINKAADAAKAGAAWNLTTNSSTTDKITVQGGDTVDLINGDNILITQDSTDKKKITVATKKDLTVDSITAGNTVMNTSGLTNGTTAITGTGITTDKVTVGGISIDKTDGINAGNKIITNVASGGTTDTNAANIGDVKQAVANLSQNLNITDGTNNGTIDLKNQKLNVAG
uniref:ESPR-type extended signal peptide-containing protein n=1 Tax=uncultured Veillonella sp. TaxID=159268 RepID=UPI0025E6C98C